MDASHLANGTTGIEGGTSRTTASRARVEVVSNY
jgi:hypothetical protein